MNFIDSAPAIEHSVVAELRPIIDAIVASLRGESRGINRSISVALPHSEGNRIVVSVRAGTARSAETRTPSRGLDERQLERVIAAIQEKIGEPISVAMLSSVAGLSRSHFSNAFRATVGRSPHAFIVRLRIERAMQLMRDTSAALSDIALETGFADQAHFSNRFRRIAGATPTQWRRSQLGSGDSCAEPGRSVGGTKRSMSHEIFALRR